jgi:chemotaxis protein methyltransferase CheR
MTMLTREQFDRTWRLAIRLAGIELFERHREILDRRSRRLGIHQGAQFDALLDAADDGDAVAVQKLIGLLTTNHTGFFRHLEHFDLAAEHALWAVHRHGAARLWSAAAATGEEPYSLAMSLIEVFRRSDPAVTVLASDIDEDALAVAREGEYGAAALGEMAAERRIRFFSPTVDARRWRLRRAPRDLVAFRGLNLTDVVWPFAGRFDVVLCRNVLMYLDASHRYAVLERIASLLAPGGLLFLDPTEHLGKAGHLFAGGTNGVYSCRRQSPIRNTLRPFLARAESQNP